MGSDTAAGREHESLSDFVQEVVRSQGDNLADLILTRALQTARDEILSHMSSKGYKEETEKSRNDAVVPESYSVSHVPSVSEGSEKFRSGCTPEKSSCFRIMCNELGVTVDEGSVSLFDLGKGQLEALAKSTKGKVYVEYTTRTAKTNHVEVVSTSAGLTSLALGASSGTSKVVLVLRPSEFFLLSAPHSGIEFYASVGGFGDVLPEDSASVAPGTRASNSGAPVASEVSGAASGRTGFRGDAARPAPPASVHEDEIPQGQFNTTGGVVRPSRRAINPKGTMVSGRYGLKNYRTAGVTVFNNLDELYLDSISRIRAQEILEDLFDTWSVPTQEVEAVSYAEDLVWAFLVARTASNKADYNAAFDIPAKSGAEVVADFAQFSALLASKYGVTRRQFARGVADDIKAYLLREENKFLLPVLANRLGSDPQHAALCFDGSTHCNNLTSSEASFTKLLEARNLFERDDVIAEGASGRLMQGMHGGVRSVVPR